MSGVGWGNPDAETVRALPLRSRLGWSRTISPAPGRTLTYADHIVPYLRIFLRGFVQVTLVSLNVRQVSSGNYPGAFVVGGLISAVWWSNSSKSREDAWGAGAVYALGAACGTVFGMWLGRG